MQTNHLMLYSSSCHCGANNPADLSSRLLFLQDHQRDPTHPNTMAAECYGWKDLLGFAGNSGNFVPVSVRQQTERAPRKSFVGGPGVWCRTVWFVAVVDLPVFFS